MNAKRRFLISYICDNQPNTMEVSRESVSLSLDDAEKIIKLAYPAKSASITNIRVVGSDFPYNFFAHLGHDQHRDG